jgi:hypothetical protein
LPSNPFIKFAFAWTPGIFRGFGLAKKLFWFFYLGLMGRFRDFINFSELPRNFNDGLVVGDFRKLSFEGLIWCLRG